ncbi:hypothetical protein OGAPHI_002821 [Ogataea philodendri]|uniref:Uncharacterized protein n=1 Tax=Ogataea philodendri TaxID=1378263 RepID=A0A9P8P8A1_9ASCO|nr:uncharacterized protein OGAPHI_002821 [Ogataea philodendri]KAH3667172.1 hypothetical protein OGAPHI_002821 [Ogataea philodendri]
MEQRTVLFWLNGSGPVWVSVGSNEVRSVTKVAAALVCSHGINSNHFSGPAFRRKQFSTGGNSTSNVRGRVFSGLDPFVSDRHGIDGVPAFTAAGHLLCKSVDIVGKTVIVVDTSKNLLARTLAVEDVGDTGAVRSVDSDDVVGRELGNVAGDLVGGLARAGVGVRRVGDTFSLLCVVLDRSRRGRGAWSGGRGGAGGRVGWGAGACRAGRIAVRKAGASGGSAQSGSTERNRARVRGRRSRSSLGRGNEVSVLVEELGDHHSDGRVSLSVLMVLVDRGSHSRDC